MKNIKKFVYLLFFVIIIFSGIKVFANNSNFLIGNGNNNLIGENFSGINNFNFSNAGSFSKIVLDDIANSIKVEEDKKDFNLLSGEILKEIQALDETKKITNNYFFIKKNNTNKEKEKIKKNIEMLVKKIVDKAELKEEGGKDFLKKIVSFLEEKQKETNSDLVKKTINDINNEIRKPILEVEIKERVNKKQKKEIINKKNYYNTSIKLNYSVDGKNILTDNNIITGNNKEINNENYSNTNNTGTKNIFPEIAYTGDLIVNNNLTGYNPNLTGYNNSFYISGDNLLLNYKNLNTSTNYLSCSIEEKKEIEKVVVQLFKEWIEKNVINKGVLNKNKKVEVKKIKEIEKKFWDWFKKTTKNIKWKNIDLKKIETNLKKTKIYLFFKNLKQGNVPKTQKVSRINKKGETHIAEHYIFEEDIKGNCYYRNFTNNIIETEKSFCKLGETEIESYQDIRLKDKDINENKKTSLLERIKRLYKNKK